MSTSENRREFWLNHWNAMQSSTGRRSDFSNNMFPSHRRHREQYDPRRSERWEALAKEGKSPKEIWEERFKELGKINENFDTKIPYFEKAPSETDAENQEKFAPFEQIQLLFIKPDVREMQVRWEGLEQTGKSAEEFWNKERESLSTSRPRWHHRHHGYGPTCRSLRKHPEESRLFREFDF